LGAQALTKTKPEFTIAFDELESLRGKPVLSVLEELRDLVQDIVDNAEASFF
jgi:hypothetical protein